MVFMKQHLLCHSSVCQSNYWWRMTWHNSPSVRRGGVIPIIWSEVSFSAYSTTSMRKDGQVAGCRSALVCSASAERTCCLSDLPILPTLISLEILPNCFPSGCTSVQRTYQSCEGRYNTSAVPRAREWECKWLLNVEDNDSELATDFYVFWPDWMLN